MTTLDDLKRAIDSFQAELNHPRGDNRYDLQLSRAKAWRTAFEWRVGFTERWRSEDVLVRERDLDAWEAEEEEGMRLIRERLK
jgi:hypothetical protein